LAVNLLLLTHLFSSLFLFSVFHLVLVNQNMSGKWNLGRAITPADEETGSTDVSTRESGEDGHLHHHHHQPQRQHNVSDNVSTSSFPLLSTNAKEGFQTNEDDMVHSHKDHRAATATPEMSYPVQAPVHYASQPGNTIPQLSVRNPQQQQQEIQLQRLHIRQQESQSQHTSLQQHPDITEHGEELARLEKHLKALEAQHNQLEQEILERQRLQDGGNTREGIVAMEDEDDRPRAVRFSPVIARNMEGDRPDPVGVVSSTLAPKESPTSVTQYGNEDSNDKSDSYSSGVTPKNLFQPKSILRRKEPVLDSTGRYPGLAATTRGRGFVPVFVDSEGREVSPIRSPHRPVLQEQSEYQMPSSEPEEEEEIFEIPDNPDDKDIALLFDSDADADLGIEAMRREVNNDVVNDALCYLNLGINVFADRVCPSFLFDARSLTTILV